MDYSYFCLRLVATSTELLSNDKRVIAFAGS